MSCFAIYLFICLSPVPNAYFHTVKNYLRLSKNWIHKIEELELHIELQWFNNKTHDFNMVQQKNIWDLPNLPSPNWLELGKMGTAA